MSQLNSVHIFTSYLYCISVLYCCLCLCLVVGLFPFFLLTDSLFVLATYPVSPVPLTVCTITVLGEELTDQCLKGTHHRSVVFRLCSAVPWNPLWTLGVPANKFVSEIVKNNCYNSFIILWFLPHF